MPLSRSRSSQTGRSRSGTPRSPMPTRASSTSTSGASGSGWMWSSMTGCPRSTTSSSTATPAPATSSGVPWWRRPMPSRCQWGWVGGQAGVALFLGSGGLHLAAATHTQVRGRCRHSKFRAQYPEHSQLNLRQVRWRPGLKGPWAPRVRSSYSYLLLPGKTEAQAGVLR